ncbi:MAG: tRNA (adenosine(37)-N6)-threonylcarbamoyltransferase complex transferase subunit TsaD [Patescibacteria group bacterium]
MKILAIETSCDDTAIALIEASGTTSAPKFKVLKSIISSQIEVHRPWGGVVPNLAKREHIKNLPKIFDKLKIKGEKLKIDAICVTVGPGLEPALWAGITFAEEIYKKLKTENKKMKLIGINHLEGHLYSFLLSQKTKTSISNSQFSNKTKNNFPAIALIVSGGHTILLHMQSPIKWKKLGETKDDAVGESFDKVAKMLGFPYPGGPEIQRLAEKGNVNAIRFPRPMIGSKDYNFSYSGLKTSVLYYLRDNAKTKKEDVAASFQEAALDVLIKKTERAAREYGVKSIFLSGGVAANKELRKKLTVLSSKLKINFIAPPMDFNTDNAVMIAVAGYMSMLRKKNKKLIANGNMGI